MGHVVELQNVLLPRPHRFRALIDCKLSLCSSLNGMKSLHRCPGPKYPLATCMDHGPLLKLIRLRALAEMELDVLFLGVEGFFGDSHVVKGLLLGRRDPDSQVYQRVGQVRFDMRGPKLGMRDFEAWMKEITIA